MFAPDNVRGSYVPDRVVFVRSESLLVVAQDFVAYPTGVDFSVEDKWLIAQQLDALGIDYIEAGYPGANPTDTKLFAEARAMAPAILRAVTGSGG